MQTHLFTTLDPQDFRSLLAETVSTAVRQEIVRVLEQPSQYQKQFLTRKEVAEVLGISLPTLHQKTISGMIKSYRIGTRVRYKSSEIEQVLEEIKVR